MVLLRLQHEWTKGVLNRGVAWLPWFHSERMDNDLTTSDRQTAQKGWEDWRLLKTPTHNVRLNSQRLLLHDGLSIWNISMQITRSKRIRVTKKQVLDMSHGPSLRNSIHNRSYKRAFAAISPLTLVELPIKVHPFYWGCCSKAALMTE
jgi:hypothetical protein